MNVHNVNQYENPPPYSPLPDHNSYIPNNTTTYYSQTVMSSQPLPQLNANAYQPNYGSIQIVPQQVIIIGSCPECGIGILEDDFTCLGILLAILFFPIGILCCLALRQRRCPNCGITFE